MTFSKERACPILAREPLFCPLCCSGFVKLLMSNLEIHTGMGDVHRAEGRGLVAYLCREGHVFFVCQSDLEQQPK